MASHRVVSLGHFLPYLGMRVSYFLRLFASLLTIVINCPSNNVFKQDLATRSIWCNRHQVLCTGNYNSFSSTIKTPPIRPVITLAPSDAIPINFARQTGHSASRTRTVRLKILTAVCLSNIGTAATCRLWRPS